MVRLKRDSLDKLAILQRGDAFRRWTSFDDRRVCMLCDRNFSGRDVLMVREGADYELHCPTHGCRGRVHQWVYPGNLLISEEAYADWWKALGEPLGRRTQLV